MSSILPFASGPHRVWSPVANDIHAAVWDRVGLETVQGFVREWASDWTAQVNTAEVMRQQQFAFARQAHQYADDRTLNLIADNLPDDWQLKESLWEPMLPELPLPPSHRSRSTAEKWAALAAVHDVFDLSGDKILPWPIPGEGKDLATYTEWMRGEGGAYLALLRMASELTETCADSVDRWLVDVEKAAPGESEVAASTDFRSVRWSGKLYSFTVNQAPVIRLLYENWRAGAPDVGDETLLSAVDPEAPPARLSTLFRENSAWGTLIVPGGSKGSHRLADPSM